MTAGTCSETRRIFAMLAGPKMNGRRCVPLQSEPMRITWSRDVAPVVSAASMRIGDYMQAFTSSNVKEASMSLTKTIVCLAIVLATFPYMTARAQATDPSVLLAQLQDPNPSTRGQAFYQVQALSPLTDQFKLALINLLGTETNNVRQTEVSGVSLTEAYTNYYADVITAVAALNDVRAVGALTDVIETGNIAIKGVASLGGAAIDPLISRLSGNSDVRTAVYLTFKTMLQPQNIVKVSDLLSISKIAVAVNKGSSDIDPFVHKTVGEDLAIIRGLTIPIDLTPPTTSISISPQPNGNGWERQNAAITLTAVDNPGGVGVKNVQAVLSGAQTGNVSVNGSTANFSITNEGATTISFSATDNAGSQESPKQATVQLDKTPPTVTCSLKPNVLWPADHKLVSITATVSVSDALSGPDGFVLQSVTSSEPDNGLGDGDQPNDIQGFAAGQPSTAGQLRAERSGTGAGRVYTLTYQGKDRAGNVNTCTATVTVPHDQGK